MRYTDDELDLINWLKKLKFEYAGTYTYIKHMEYGKGRDVRTTNYAVDIRNILEFFGKDKAKDKILQGMSRTASKLMAGEV